MSVVQPPITSTLWWIAMCCIVMFIWVIRQLATQNAFLQSHDSLFIFRLKSTSKIYLDDVIMTWYQDFNLPHCDILFCIHKMIHLVNLDQMARRDVCHRPYTDLKNILTQNWTILYGPYTQNWPINWAIMDRILETDPNGPNSQNQPESGKSWPDQHLENPFLWKNKW